MQLAATAGRDLPLRLPPECLPLPFQPVRPWPDFRLFLLETGLGLHSGFGRRTTNSDCYFVRLTPKIANEMSQDRRTKAVVEFATRQLQAGRVGFALQHLLDETGLSEPAARSQLWRQREWIVRVPSANSFFVIVAPEHRVQGAPPVEWWIDDYFHTAGRPYYIALQSAAAALGSSPQAIQMTQVVTDAPRKPVQIGRQRISFFLKQKAAGTPTQQLPAAYAPARVSAPAATAFDLVRYAEKIGGIGRVVETLRPMLAKVRPLDLAAVIAFEDEIASAQRLGFVLEKLGHPRLANAIDRWLPAKRPLTALSPGRPREGAVDRRWRVLDNSAEFSS